MPVGAGSLVELAKRVGQQRQGVAAGRLLHHPLCEPGRELEPRPLRRALDDLGQAGAAQRLDDEGVVHDLRQPGPLGAPR